MFKTEFNAPRHNFVKDAASTDTRQDFATYVLHAITKKDTIKHHEITPAHKITVHPVKVVSGIINDELTQTITNVMTIMEATLKIFVVLDIDLIHRNVVTNNLEILIHAHHLLECLFESRKI